MGDVCVLYYIKQLSPSDAACSKQIKLPRSKARKFAGELRHKQRAMITFMDQREQLWDFLCTCYGCQYALSRVAVFCNTYQLRAGQHLIFYRDVLKRLRIAVISSMPGKLLQELASCSDSLPCKQQLLLPELSYPSSSEEPTDTAEAEDDEQPPSAAAQQASAASAALAAWHTAAVGSNAAAGCQQHSQQALQFVLQGAAAGTTALQPAALADGCGEISAGRIHDPPAVASILADKTNWQLLQRQALPEQQQPWRTTACGSEGPWATASADAAKGAPAPGTSPCLTLSDPSGLSLECEERLDELESPRPGTTSTRAHLLQQQQRRRLQSEAVAGAPAACAPGHHQQQQQLDAGPQVRQDQAQAGGSATAGGVTVAAVAARKSSRPAGGHSSAVQKQAGSGEQGGLGRKRLLEGLAGEPEPEQPCPAASTGATAGGCFSRLAADCCFSSGPAGKRLREGTCSFPGGGGVVAGAAAPGPAGTRQQQQQQLDNSIRPSLTTSALPGAAGSVVALHPGAAVTDPGPVQQQSNNRPALPGGCRLLHAGSLVLDRGTGGRAAAGGADLPSITRQASGLSGKSSSAAAPAGQQQGLAACAVAPAPGVAAASGFGRHRSDGQQPDLSSKLLEMEEWSAITGLLMLSSSSSSHASCLAC